MTLRVCKKCIVRGICNKYCYIARIKVANSLYKSIFIFYVSSILLVFSCILGGFKLATFFLVVVIISVIFGAYYENIIPADRKRIL